MDSKGKSMQYADCSGGDGEYYVTPPGSLNSSWYSPGGDNLNSSNTESDHEFTRTENSDEGYGVVASLKATTATSDGDGELEGCNNEIPFHHPAAPIRSSSSSTSTSTSLGSSSKTNRAFTGLGLGLGLPPVSRKRDPIIEIDLTKDSEDEMENPETSPRQMPLLLPLPLPPPAISVSKLKSKRPKTQIEVEPALTVKATASKPQPSAAASDFSQYQQNPSVNYFCQWPWGANVQNNIPSDIIPPPPDFSSASFDFSFFPSSRYPSSVPGKPRTRTSTLITINTKADASSTAPTRTPLASADSLVPVSVPTPNPQPVSASADVERRFQEQEGGDNGTMLPGVGIEVKDELDRNKNQPCPTCTCTATAAVVRTASLSPSGHKTTEPVPVPVPVKRGPRPRSRPLTVRSRFVKHGFHRLYDISTSTDAAGNLEEYLCIVGRCEFGSKIYNEIENHLAEKHLKSTSSELTGKLALFASFTFIPLSTSTLNEGQSQLKTKFVCNFLGCKKETVMPSEKSRHVSKDHLDKRNYCHVVNCHEKFLYEKQLALHLATFHGTEGNNGGK